MAFGDRKAKFIGPVCERSDCKRPLWRFGLCLSHWRLASEIERRFRKLMSNPSNPSAATGVEESAARCRTCTEYDVQRLLDGVENFLRDPSRVKQVE